MKDIRIGTVCYASDQGIAHLAKWFYQAGVIQEVMVFRHGSRPSNKQWYPGDTVELVGRPFTGPDVDRFLSSITHFLFFETPFDWEFLRKCRKAGVKTVGVPMYECTPVALPHPPDKWICPSKLDQQYFPGSPFLQIPVPPEVRWQQRTKAFRFLHNGGNLGLREHKGTRQILEAFKLLTKPVNLTVRAQDTSGLRRMVSEVFGSPNVGGGRDHLMKRNNGQFLTVEYEAKNYNTLFDGFDVFVMAEKYNGLSLPLIEARASGMLVMTSDRFPMNDWLPSEPLIPVNSYSKQRVGGPYHWYDEAEVRPEDIAATMDGWYGKDITEYSNDGRVWGEKNSWANLKDEWVKEITK